MSYQRVIIEGNLGADPELRYAGESPVCSLRVACGEKFKAKNGEMKEHTEWFSVQVWGKQGENCSKYLTKGQKVLVEGRNRTRSYDDKDGNKRYATDVIADRVVFLGGGKGREPGSDDAEPDFP